MSRRTYEIEKKRHFFNFENVFSDIDGNERSKETELKTLLSVIGMQFAMFLLTVYKKPGLTYLPVTLLLVLITIVSYCITVYFNGDKYMLITAIILLSTGFLVQNLEAGNDFQLRNFLLKFIVAIVTGTVTVIIYPRTARFLSEDPVICLLISIQFLICILLLVLGSYVGNSKDQSAKISLGGFTPLEIIKVMYIFVTVGLICRSENKICIGKWKIKIDRELFWGVYSMILLVICALCNELGTPFLIFSSGLLLWWIFGKHSKISTAILILFIVGIGVFWILCDRKLYPMLLEGKIMLPDVVNKIVERFGSALHPERSSASAGFQGTLALEEIAMGGWFGISSEKYRLSLPEASNDFAFCNVVQSAGCILGAAVILCYVILLRRGLVIAKKQNNIYFRGLAAGISILFVMEAVIHIGYNGTLGLPITGIPLYLVSSGFTAIITGGTLIAILLVLSTKRIESI